MFTTLYVTGNVYVEESINGTKWSELDDLILKNEENVRVTGVKTFLGNVHIMDNLTITTGLINGHSTRDFITLDTEQKIPSENSFFNYNYTSYIFLKFSNSFTFKICPNFLET